MTCPNCKPGITVGDSAIVVSPFPAQEPGPSANMEDWSNLPVGSINPSTGTRIGYARCSSCGRMWHPLSGYAMEPHAPQAR